MHKLLSSDDGKKTQTKLNSIYVANKNAIVDLNYIVNQKHPLGNIDLNTIGSLDDSAQKSYKGTINFLKGCKKSVGKEKEFCLMLSSASRSKALPMILCTEEDVEGSHATSTGKVDDSALYYIQTRGLDKKAATKLLIMAKFDQSIKQIKNLESQKEILKELEGKIDATK